jgi:hypothetical protein
MAQANLLDAHCRFLVFIPTHKNAHGVGLLVLVERFLHGAEYKQRPSACRETQTSRGAHQRLLHNAE